ncbi:protein SMG5-like isoform X1 [Pomacea canaliculata]|uniref:protein SMG5-like isoform X1 n=1 Tax=Pomacea canaliculata TaxID=400727 RepID=UPI000D737B23|nr:protein SMG5-like isoform X1 [Pomacea canaliculata]
MKRVAALGNEPKTDADRAKRAYRGAVEAIRCLDDIYKQKKILRDVFRQDAVALRNRLKEYCERLMFLNPVEYGRKAEEVLWRKVFYQIIQMFKHNKKLKQVRHHGSLETAYRTHLAGAMGYYQHLLFRLQQDFHLSLTGVLDFQMVTDSRITGINNSRKMWSSMAQEWAQRACHRCLICLGDIARYQRDIDHTLSAALSQRFYHQAFMLFPEIGMPHNQLGTLAGGRSFSCDAAYHYFRCLACDKPFDGAQGNLKRLFEKNQTRIQHQNHAARDLPPDMQRLQDIQGFLVGYLKLMEIFSGSEDSMPVTELQCMCQQTLQDFNLCMFYEPGAATTIDMIQDLSYSLDHPQYLDDDLVFKIITSLICNIHLLQKIGSRHVTVATAFLLALFSHTLNHVIIRLQGALYDKENPNKLLDSGLLAEDHPDEASSDCMDEVSPSPPVKPKEEVSSDRRESNSSGPPVTDGNMEEGKNLAKDPAKRLKSSRIRNLRRRRRRHPSDSSSDLTDMSEESDLSEGGDDVEEDDENLSEDSEDDLVNFFDNDSDSELSDSIMDSEDRPSQNDSKVLNKEDATKSSVNGEISPQTGSKGSKGSRPARTQGGSGDWSNLAERNTLANMSSELFSSSGLFLGQNLSLDLGHYANGISAAHCNEVMQGKTHVPVPPGFLSSEEAMHVADITEKLANFVIETDTEASIAPTDTEQSGMTDTDEADNEQSSSSAAEKHELEQRHLQQVLQVIQGEGLLTVVKIMCDWMICQAPIITACAQSSQSLWNRLSVLLNFLPHENDLVQHDECWQEELKGVIASTRWQQWMQVFPITEDIELCQLPPLAEIHAHLDFTTSHRGQLTDMQETFVRICALRHFGYFLSKMEGFDFTYQDDQAMFFGPKSPEDVNDGNEKLAQERMRDADTRRNQLMRDMAQLRLQAEVSQLEGCLESAQQPHFPPYVIVDAASLCTALGLVRELAQSSRCIVIIPLAVIDQLDVQKKESSGAREAIRWLEAEFRRGNRYIRAQKSNETVSANNQRISKKRHRNLWYMMEVLGCGRYLARQSSHFTSGSVVAILTAHSLFADNPPAPVQHVQTASQEEGVSIENIKEFVSKWRPVWQSNG